MVIHNYVEKMVENLLPDIMLKADMCQCEICKTDVAAMALNHIKPRYVVSEKGALYTRLSSLDGQTEAEVISEIEKACAVVKNNPSH